MFFFTVFMSSQNVQCSVLNGLKPVVKKLSPFFLSKRTFYPTGGIAPESIERFDPLRNRVNTTLSTKGIK